MGIHQSEAQTDAKETISRPLVSMKEGIDPLCHLPDIREGWRLGVIDFVANWYPNTFHAIRNVFTYFTSLVVVPNIPRYCFSLPAARQFNWLLRTINASNKFFEEVVMTVCVSIPQIKHIAERSDI